MTATLKQALKYARDDGWAVFPLNGKVPFKGTKGHHDASVDPARITALFRNRPTANIGIRCDSTRGPIVIDIDGPAGRDALAELERQHGPIETLEASSGRPHRKHLYFSPPLSGASVPRRIKALPELDVLGDGGYVVAPPSLRDNGKRYGWLNDEAIAALPECFVALTDGGQEPKTPHVAGPVGDRIPEGSRDDTLTSLAGSMRRRGFDEAAIYAALKVENAAKCRPPLPDAQVRKIARSIARKAPAPSLELEPINDITLGRLFAHAQHGALRYCPSWRRWLCWDGTRWAKDYTHEAERRIEAMVHGLFGQLGQVGDADKRERLFKDLNGYTRRRKLDDVLAIASRQVEVVVSPERLDIEPWLFNTTSGTIDLRTGALRPHDPADLSTKLAPVVFDAKAKAPRWDAFIRDITRGDAALATYLQRAVGYTMAGVTPEHVLFFGHGAGANGKTTFLEVIYHLFGDYAATIDFDTLLHHRYGGGAEARRDLPRLDKARFVMADEAPQNARWDERTIKKLTGGNTLSARWLYGEKFDFAPTHTLWCQANEQPTSYDPSHAFWRRLRLIPFTHQVPAAKQNKDLQAQLIADELPGILNWALRGCRDWQRAKDGGEPNALGEPVSVREATQLYQEDQDVVGEFIAARCQRHPQAWTPLGELYVAFTTWWKDTRGAHATPLSRDAFGRSLARRDGLTSVKRHNVRGWKGVASRIDL